MSTLYEGLSDVLKVGLLGVLASACFMPWRLGFATRNMAFCMFGVVCVLWLIGVLLL